MATIEERLAALESWQAAHVKNQQRDLKVLGARVTALEATVAELLEGTSGPPPVDPPPPPPVDPPPVDPPPPATGGNVLGVDFTKRPRTGSAWNRMVAASKSLGPVTLTDTGGANNGELLAAAFVAAATGDAAMRTAVIARCEAALNGSHARTLEQARNLAPIAIALSALGEHGLDAELRRERDFKADSQGSVIDCHKVRPNNWGTCSGLARIAVSAHIGDSADLVAAVQVHKGWLGDRSAYAGFKYGDLSWQADPSKPVGINPKGATKSGTVIDGVLPDDQRRAAAFPDWSNENYVWQALGEIAATQAILRHNGYGDVLFWSDSAVQRAYALYASRGYGCSGDDGWQYAAAYHYGVTLQHDGYAPGKSFGWFDWLYGYPGS